jgi:glycosyltransferase involved in cell wall biosynthesis
MPYLEKCLESILTAAKDLPIEILYEDALSTDGSLECAIRLLGPTQVNSQADSGYGEALNRAFKKAKGEIFYAIPADDILDPNSLKLVLDAFDKNPSAQWAIGLYKIIDQDGLPTRILHSTYKNFAILNFRTSWLFVENIIPFVSFFIKRTFREEIGEILSERVSLANDYEYFLRCAKRSSPLIIPHTLGIWRYHCNSQSGKNMTKMSFDCWKACVTQTNNIFLIALNLIFSVRNALFYKLL